MVRQRIMVLHLAAVRPSPFQVPIISPLTSVNRVEMNVGIIAACLPTLKPLFANFFGQIRALTSGSVGRSAGLSGPFKSSGYLKQNDRSDGGSYAMNNFSVDASMSKEGAVIYGGPNNRDRRWSKAAESDESILPHQGAAPKGKVIVRTTEVNVSSPSGSF